MSQVKYDNFTYKRKSGEGSSRKGFPWFFTSVVVTSLGVCVLVANMFFGFLNFVPAKNVTIAATEFYAVKMKDFPNRSDANIYAAEKRILGAAGFVVNNNKNSVYAAIYANQEDAQRVAEQIRPQIPEASVEKISSKKTSFQITNMEHKRLCEDIVNSFTQSYQMLYNLAINFDSDQIGLDVVRAESIKAYNNLKKSVDELTAINKTEGFAFYTRLIDSANVQLLLLYNLAYGSNFVYGISSEIKNTYCTIVNAYLEFTKI